MQVRAYKQLAALQGDCLPVLEAAGLFGDNGVIVAISGVQHTRADAPPADVSPQTLWDALDSLQCIHDCGVLYGRLDMRSLLVQQRPQVGFVVCVCVLCWSHACCQTSIIHVYGCSPSPALWL